MKMTSVLFASVLAIFTLSIAAAKTYDVTFASNTKAGTAQLKAGEYKIKIEGTKVTFIDQKTRKEFTTEVKVENSPKSFEYTRVDATTDGGNNVVKYIEVGGSKIKIEF